MDILFGTIGQVNLFLSQGKTNIAKRILKDAIYRLQPLYDKDEQKYGNPLSLFSFFLMVDSSSSVQLPRLYSFVQNA